MKRALLILAASAITVIAFGQASPVPQAPASKTMVLDPVQGGWTPMTPVNHQVEERSDATAPLNALDQFRALRTDALARNQGTLTSQDKAALRQLADAISTASPNSFEAHLARFHVEFPDPNAFMSLDLAKARDRDRPELIAPMLLDAARGFNREALQEQAKALKKRGNVAPGLWTHADDVLLSVAEGGILFTAGEMDAYPIWARQYADGSRPDVLVIDHRMLMDPAYRRRIWSATKAKGAEPGTAVGFVERLSASTTRPVHISLALGSAMAGVPPANLYLVGMAMRVSSTAVDNLPLLEQRWAQMAKNTACGPLGQNYLVPASVLLKHYRTLNDEVRASRLEHELRGMAKQLGATNRLYQAGVLEH